MLRQRMVFFCLTLLFACVFSASASACMPPIPSAETALTGMNWTAKSESTFLTKGFWGPTFSVLVSNEENSAEKVTFAVYKEDDAEHPVVQGEVEPGKSVLAPFTISESGNYYVTLGVTNPPNVCYFLPPSKGTAKIGLRDQ